MLIDFSKKKKLVAYREKTTKKSSKGKTTQNNPKQIKASEIDTLLLKSKDLLDETPSIFADIPYENTEIAVIVNPCSKTHRNAVSLYEQYENAIN